MTNLADSISCQWETIQDYRYTDYRTTLHKIHRDMQEMFEAIEELYELDYIACQDIVGEITGVNVSGNSLEYIIKDVKKRIKELLLEEVEALLEML